MVSEHGNKRAIFRMQRRRWKIWWWFKIRIIFLDNFCYLVRCVWYGLSSGIWFYFRQFFFFQDMCASLYIFSTQWCAHHYIKLKRRSDGAPSVQNRIQEIFLLVVEIGTFQIGIDIFLENPQS